MSPERRNGGPPARAAASNTALITYDEHGQRSARRGPLVAVGIYYPPSGRRRLGAIVVRSCPACLHLHLHRAAGPVASTPRTGSCGAEYVIRVARVGGVV
jgi:hypothetical protein